MTTAHPRTARRSRRGMTLIEVIIAVVILSGAMLGLANFGRRFQHATQNASDGTLASDLAAARMETIKGYRVYANLVATYDAVSETFTDPVYKGFTRYTHVVRTNTTSDDYTTVTVKVTGNSLSAPLYKTTVIAKF